MSEKIVLIDGHSILNRAFYGIPELTNSEGLHTNAVYGFLNILFKILDEEKAQYLAVAFDLKAPTFRHKMYAEYKGTRKAMPEELREQVPVMKEVLSAMGVPLLMKEGYEADDLLGTIAGQAERAGLEVSIVSGDRDLLQLATDRDMAFFATSFDSEADSLVSLSVEFFPALPYNSFICSEKPFIIKGSFSLRV